MGNRSELPYEEREALQLEVIEQLAGPKWKSEKGKGGGQSGLAKAAGCSQPAIAKIVDRAEAGTYIAARVVKALGYPSFEPLVKKHRTKVTANDIAHCLDRSPPLAETLRRDNTRWEVATLVTLVRRIVREPALSRADGEPSRGTWASILDEIADGREPVVLRAVENFERPKQ